MNDEFSENIQSWLDSDKEKTIAELGNIFEEKSFAITFMILMFPAALPLPTGGVTHLFEVITIILSLELIAQRKTIWLPEKWKNKNLGKTMIEKILPRIIKFINKTERISHPRMPRLLESQTLTTVFGLIVLVFTTSAFLAPPFSGLDTLPAMGIIGISLGVILQDIIFFCVGLILGTSGIVVTVGFAATITKWLSSLF